MFKPLLFVLALAAVATPAIAGAWVYRDTSVDYNGTAGHCPSCCNNQPEATGRMDDGRAVFSGNQFATGGFGTCGDKTWRTHSQFAWQSPPRLLAPVKPLSLDTAIHFADVTGESPGNPLQGTLQVRLDYPKKTTQDQRDTLSTLSFAPDKTFNKEASKTQTVTIPYGEAGQQLYIEIFVNAGTGLGGYYFYHYVYDPDAVAPAANVASGSAAITPDDAAEPAAAGAENSSAGTSTGPSETVPVRPMTAIATVLGGLLITFGAAVASGLAGTPPGAIGSTLADALTGKGPGDGFEEWQKNAAKIYGTGKPDDPFRDYPDPDNPPWKAKYGDGTSANPFSDTAPPVIDHSPTRPAIIETTVDLKPVSATPAGAPIAIHTEPLKANDAPLQKLTPVAVPKQPSVVTPEQLADLANELKKAADQLKAEGKYIANGSLIDKIWYGVPHIAKEAAVWLGDAVRDAADAPHPGNRQLTEVLTGTVGKKPPDFEPDPNWGQCGEAVKWGSRTMTAPLKRIFGPDAVITRITVQSDINPLGNHIANEVITPAGERYVVDMWASMHEGTPKIYSEDDWVQHWKNQPGISRSVTIRRGGEGSSYERALEACIRDLGYERGIKTFRAGCKGDEQMADTVINSFKTHPWVIPSKPEDV